MTYIPPISDNKITGTLTSAGTSVSIPINSLNEAGLNVTGTWTGTINMQGTIDGATWSNLTTILIGGGGIWTTTAFSTNGDFKVGGLAGFTQIRATMVSYTSGTASIIINASPAASTVNIRSGNANNSLFAQPDVKSTGSIAASTPSAAYTVAITNGQGTASFVVTGLTVSGATLVIEASDDGSVTWNAVNGITPVIGTLFTTLTTDQQFRVNCGSRTNIRLRVSVTGSGTISTASNLSVASSATSLSSPLPTGSNTIGNVVLTSSSTAAAAGIKATMTAYGYQRMTLEPRLEFIDAFDGGTVDTTNNWTQSGTVSQANSSCAIGNILTTTTVNSLTSKPTFSPLGLSFQVLAFVASFEANPLSTTNVNRFFGFGTHTGTPTVSVPVTDGVGFEFDPVSGKLWGAVWQNGVRSGSSVDLTASMSATNTRYAILYRSDLVIFYIAGTEIPVGSISFVTPYTQALPVKLQSVNGSSTPSTTPLTSLGAVAIGDTGGNSTQISDGTYPFRKAKVDSTGNLSVSITATDGNSTGNITTQNLNPNTGVATAGSTIVVASLAGKSTVTIQVIGTYTGALTPQGSTDGVNWVNLSATSLQNISTGFTIGTIASAAVGIWQVDISGLVQFRMTALAAISGTAVVTINASSSTGIVGLDSPVGQQASVNSLSVALSNEQIQELTATGQSAQTAVVNNILTTTSGSTATIITGYRSGSIQIVSTATGGTYIFEGSNDNVNFSVIPVYIITATNGQILTSAQTASSGSLLYIFSISYTYIRCRIASTITGGTIQAFSRFSQAPYSSTVLSVGQNNGVNLNAQITNITTSVTPGTAAANLGKAEDAASANGDTGIFILGVRTDTFTTTTSANGDYSQISTDKYGSISVKQQYLQKTTYSLAFTVTLATTPTDVFQIIGSASKTVMIQKLNISGSQTTGGQATVTISKRSAANTGGTSSGSTMVPHDSGDAAATAVGAIYTANPTPGAAVGSIRIFSLPLAAVTATTNNIVQLDFGERGKPIVLNGVAQALAINLGGATLTGGVLNVWMEFTEE